MLGEIAHDASVLPSVRVRAADAILARVATLRAAVCVVATNSLCRPARPVTAKGEWGEDLVFDGAVHDVRHLGVSVVVGLARVSGGGFDEDKDVAITAAEHFGSGRGAVVAHIGLTANTV